MPDQQFNASNVDVVITKKMGLLHFEATPKKISHAQVSTSLEISFQAKDFLLLRKFQWDVNYNVFFCDGLQNKSGKVAVNQETA